MPDENSINQSITLVSYSVEKYICFRDHNKARQVVKMIKWYLQSKSGRETENLSIHTLLDNMWYDWSQHWRTRAGKLIFGHSEKWNPTSLSLDWWLFVLFFMKHYGVIWVFLFCLFICLVVSLRLLLRSIDKVGVAVYRGVGITSQRKAGSMDIHP